MSRSLPLLAVGLVVGLALGFVLATAFGTGGGPAGGDGDTARLERTVSQLRYELEAVQTERDDQKAEIDRLLEVEKLSIERSKEATEEIARLKDVIAGKRSTDDPMASIDPGEAGADTPKGLTDEQLEDRLKTLGPMLQGVILGNGADKMRETMAAILKDGGPGTLQRILGIFDTVEGLGPKTVLAHALAQTGDPVALEKLKSIVLDPDAGFFDRRSASHGLAFSDDESLTAFYREVATSDIERGARANASFGLAKRTDEGIELYGKTVDEAFREKDPLAVAYLQGFMFLGKRAVPAVEKRLRTIKERQARIIMIEHLANNGNADSVAVLREIATAPDTTDDIRKAAEQAAAKLSGPGD